MELYVDLDRELAARYGFPLNQPAEVVSLTFRGRRLQRFRTPEGAREMRLTLDERTGETVSQLRNLPVWTAEGDKIPLAAMADFRLAPDPERIERENRRTGVRVGARYEEGTLNDYLPEVRAAMDSMEFPYGYTWTMSEWAERQPAVARVPAAVGLLLLIGVVVNNGIVMIEHINQYRRRGMERTAAMLPGGRERLRPILMTAITTLVGLVPIAVQRPALAGMYYYSMALVIMGGLVVSTFLTTLLLPTAATLAEDSFAAVGRGVVGAWSWVRPWRRRASAV